VCGPGLFKSRQYKNDYLLDGRRRSNHLNYLLKGKSMENDELEKKVFELISNAAAVTADRVKPESKIEDDLGIDSIDTVELALFLEDEFDIEINDEDFNKIKTVQDVIDYMKKKVK